MKTTVKDVRTMIAKYLNIVFEDVIPSRYSYSVTNISAKEVEQRIYPNKEAND